MKKILLITIESLGIIFCKAQKNEPVLVRADAKDIKENFKKALQLKPDRLGSWLTNHSLW